MKDDLSSSVGAVMDLLVVLFFHAASAVADIFRKTRVL